MIRSVWQRRRCPRSQAGRSAIAYRATVLPPSPTSFKPGFPQQQPGEARPGRAVTNLSAEMGSVIAPVPQRRSEEHTSELQSLMRISYAVFCLKKKKTHRNKYDKLTQT